jgi:hypothetical protein
MPASSHSDLTQVRCKKLVGAVPFYQAPAATHLDGSAEQMTERLCRASCLTFIQLALHNTVSNRVRVAVYSIC